MLPVVLYPAMGARLCPAGETELPAASALGLFGFWRSRADSNEVAQMFCRGNA
jgi:hypothetical protein